MSKALRIFFCPVAQILLTLLGFGAIILAGLILVPGADNLFAMYYKMFPMLGVVIASMSTATLRPYLNLALSMNGKRPHLFAAQQTYLALLALSAPVFTQAFWWLGGMLYEKMAVPLPFLALMAAGSLMLGETMSLVVGLESKARTVVYAVSIIIMVVVCGGIGAYTAIMDHEAASWFPAIPDVWLIGAALALLALAVVFAAINWMKLRKAAVEV
ncbi:MAG: hypothetical protein HFF18_00160 [Oscillospiraceae bacterium]|nr:hypothetical protein [Oscillospiraceae bacterium]